jgi:saccharopine dehydrogenase-like NADP-dependent oxidoreductase
VLAKEYWKSLKLRYFKHVIPSVILTHFLQERKLDAQIREMENLDEDDFEALRQKRRLQLQQKMRQEQDWLQLGHGR